VSFRLTFAPPGWRKAIRLEPVYLKRLPADHRTSATILDEKGNVFRAEILSARKPAVELPLHRPHRRECRRRATVTEGIHPGLIYVRSRPLTFVSKIALIVAVGCGVWVGERFFRPARVRQRTLRRARLR